MRWIPLLAIVWVSVPCGVGAGSEAAAEAKTLTYRHFRVIEEDGREFTGHGMFAWLKE